MTETLPEPKSRKESYLAKAAGVAGVELPEKPESREEQYLNAIAEGGGGGTTYTAGEGIDITEGAISVDTETIQPKLTAGTNITINEENVISASSSGSSITYLTSNDYNWNSSTNDTTEPLNCIAVWLLDDGVYSYTENMQGKLKVFKDDSSLSYLNSYPIFEINTYANQIRKVVTQLPKTEDDPDNTYYFISLQEGYVGNKCGISNTIKSIFNDPNQQTKIQMGKSASVNGQNSVAIGVNCASAFGGGVAIGAYSRPSAQGEMNIGLPRATATQINSNGYNQTAYRLLSGLYDGQSAHDAVTVQQINDTIDAINTALSTSIPHIGASS